MMGYIACFRPRTGDYFFSNQSTRTLKKMKSFISFRPRIGDYFYRN